MRVELALGAPAAPCRVVHSARLNAATIHAANPNHIVRGPTEERSRGPRGDEVDARDADTFPGFERLHAFDTHGNRIEILA